MVVAGIAGMDANARLCGRQGRLATQGDGPDEGVFMSVRSRWLLGVGIGVALVLVGVLIELGVSRDGDAPSPTAPEAAPPLTPSEALGSPRCVPLPQGTGCMPWKAVPVGRSVHQGGSLVAALTS